MTNHRERWLFLLHEALATRPLTDMLPIHLAQIQALALCVIADALDELAEFVRGEDQPREE